MGRWLLTLADISLVTVFAVLDWLLAIVPVHVQSFGYFSSTTAMSLDWRHLRVACRYVLRCEWLQF